MSTAVALLVGVVLDAVLGEPRRGHPLIAFGRYANAIETWLNSGGSSVALRLRGVSAWLLAVMPWTALAAWLATSPATHGGHWIVDALLLYFALGARSLHDHAVAIAHPLSEGRLDAARVALSRIVSRDTQPLDADGIAAAAIESVLENGNDAIFGTLFWFALFGGPGALLFRLANTLDASWGYRTPRHLHFGWAAARIDDMLNYLPARLTSLSYALLGQGRRALACWRTQAPAWASPNAGPVMAAGAGALGLQLGGPARYHGHWEERPALGYGTRPTAHDIARALRLVRHTQWLWCIILSAAILLTGRWHG